MKKSILVLFFSFIIVLGATQAEFLFESENENFNVEQLIAEMAESTGTCGGDVVCECGNEVIEDYVMTSDLECMDGTYLSIIQEGTLFDCDGYTISSNNIALITTEQNTIIKNCIISSDVMGIVASESYNEFVDNTLTSSTFIALYAEGNYQYISNNQFRGNSIGLELVGDNSDINGNIFLNNYEKGINNRGIYNIIWANNFTGNYVGAWDTRVIEEDINSYNKSGIGNYWSDFEDNYGYPYVYHVPEFGMNTDYHPIGQTFDQDNDGVDDFEDNCPFEYNPNQEDQDEDGVGDVCDNCENYNPSQGDSDGDGYPDGCDNCEFTFNPSQTDIDRDGVGDWCDNCAITKNPNQRDSDGDYIGDACQDCIYKYTTACAIPLDPNEPIIPWYPN
jgi:hypothetical protein